MPFPTSAALGLLLGLTLTLTSACAEDDSTATDSGAAAPTAGTTGSNSSGGGRTPTAADTVVWFETDEIVHERDYFELKDYINPDFPKNWLAPIDYAAGSFTFRVELLEVPNPDKTMFYTVGWKAGEAGNNDFTRISMKIDKGLGVYERTNIVRGSEKVVNGQTQGSVGSTWRYDNAWRGLGGDAWGGGYPMRVRVKMTFHELQDKRSSTP